MSSILSTLPEDLLDTLLDLPEAQRQTYLNEHCDDPVLHAEVLRLMAAADRATHYMAGLGRRLGIANLLDPDEPPPPSRNLGAYRLIRLLGRGGMGAVYLAERADGQYEQQVAIKLLPFGAGDDLSRRRFASERRILARLSHPNIARLLDGGIADHDTPYFVMEYVRGVPIDQHCKDRALTIEQRIRTFLPVCDAVAYAHRNLVVHRDIKPGNVLVDEAGEVKLLDFGVAKLTTQGSDHLTLPGNRPLTVRYASPEALRGEPDSTAADVYSLGMLLYILLTGTYPYPESTDDPAALTRRILDQEPLPASQAVIDAPTDSTQHIARAQQHGLSSLARQLKGDLDTILSSALHKDPEKRYADVEQFRRDLERHLAHEPIIARAPSFTYVASRFVRRRKGLVAGVGAIAVLSVALVGLGIDYTLTTRRHAELVALERDTTTEIQNFLVDIFKSSSPEQTAGSTVTARELLDRGASRVLEEFPDRPALQAPLLMAIAQAYEGLTVYKQARTHYENSLNVYRQIGATETPAYVRNLFQLAYVYERLGNYAQAEQLSGQGIELAEALNEQSLLADNLVLSARLMQRRGAFAGVEDRYRQALAIRQKVFGLESHETAETPSHLATVLQQQSDLAGAEKLHLQALKIRQKIESGARPSQIEHLYNLGVVTRQQGRLEDARDYYLQALDIINEYYPEGYSDEYYLLNGLGLVYRDLGDPARALEYLQESERKIEMRYGPEHPNLAFSYANQGEILAALGRHQAAAESLRRSLTIFEHTMPTHPALDRTRAELNKVLDALAQ